MWVHLVTLSFLLWNYFLSADGNAMLNPKHRGMIWARTAYNSGGYNYMGINCGGTHKVKQHDGECGLCGDPVDGVRKHETGGKFATGKLSQRYRKGDTNMHVRVLLNSDQGGYFEFRLCVLNGSKETQACFDQHLLVVTEGRAQGDQFAYVVQEAGLLSLTVEIPEKLQCNRCILQWKYVTGNTFGRDKFGHGCLGCGPQETFINCADIKIDGWEAATLAPAVTLAATGPPTPPTTYYATPPATPPSTTLMVTTTTPRPTTTAATTRAPVTTKPKQIIKPNQNTQATQHRQTVTDVDEGSRGHSRTQHKKYQVYTGVIAPNFQSAIQPAAPKKGAKVTGVPIAVQPPAPAPAVIVQPVPKAPAPAPVVAVPQYNLQVKTHPHPQPQPQPHLKPKPKPKIGGGIGIPFNIPPPPKLSVEQIDALNNNKNIIPHHDSMQKYVQVGASKIIAARDFTTRRTQHVHTPPTMLKKSTSPTWNVAVGNSKHSASSFGGLTVYPPKQHQRLGVSSFANEYSSAVPNMQSQQSRGPLNPQVRSSIDSRNIILNSPGEKPKLRYGRTPTPVPLLPERYRGLQGEAMNPYQNRYQPNQYSGPLPSRYQPTIPATQQQQQQQQQLNQQVRSTMIPVVETSTHRTSKRVDTIAPWRPFHRSQNNEQNVVDKPITLFKSRKDTTFRPPAINERYTNFKIGAKGKRTRSDINNAKPAEQTLDPNVHVNSGLHSPENYFGQDVHVYYKNEPGMNADVFPASVTNLPSQPTQLDSNPYSSPRSGNAANTIPPYQNNAQPHSFSMNAFDAYNNENKPAIDAGIVQDLGTVKGDKSVSSFVKHQSSSTDNFNVYKAAGMPEKTQQSSTGGRLLEAPSGGNKQVNVLFDAFGSATDNSLSGIKSLGVSDNKQSNQQQQNSNINLLTGQFSDPYQQYQQQQQQQQQTLQPQQQQQQQQTHQPQQYQQQLQYPSQYQQHEQTGVHMHQQQHQQHQQYPGQYQQQQQDLQLQQQYQQQQQYPGQSQKQPDQYHQQQQQQFQQQQQPQHTGQYQHYQQQQYLGQQLQPEPQQQQHQQYPAQDQQQQYNNQYLNQQQQQSQNQQLPDIQQNTPVHFLGQFHKSANGNNANSNTNLMFGTNAFASGQSALNPTGQAWWQNQNMFKITPPSTTVSTVPAPSPTTQTTTQPTTTQPNLQTTTDKMDLQIAELKRLREKLDQLQQLINLRQKGFDEPTLPPTVVTTSDKTTKGNPITLEQSTQSFLAANPQNGQASGGQTSGGQTTRDSVRELLEKILKRRYMKQSGSTNPVVPTTTVAVHSVQKTTTASRSVISTTDKATTTTTLPSTMPKNTAEYIAGLKEKMLQSIKEANEKKNKVTQSSPGLLRNNEVVYGTTKSFDSLLNVDLPLQTQVPTMTTKNWPKPETKQPDVNKQAVLNKLMELRARMKQRRMSQTKVKQEGTTKSINIQNPTTLPTIREALSPKVAIRESATSEPIKNEVTRTSESVIAAFLNRDKGIAELRQVTTVATSSLAAEMGAQSLEKPAMREMHVENTIKRQQIVDVAALSNGGTEQTLTTTPDKAYERRLELLRRMRKYMVQRPTHLPTNRPSLLDRAVDSSSANRLTPRYNRPVHIIDHPNNGRPTIYDNDTVSNTVPAAELLIRNNGQYTPDSGTNFQHVQQQNYFNSATEHRAPDVGVSMLDRVKLMLERNKHGANTSRMPTTAASRTTSTVRVITKDMLLKMLQSMSANRQSVHSGR